MVGWIVSVLFLVGFGGAAEMVRTICRRWLTTPKRAYRVGAADPLRHRSIDMAPKPLARFAGSSAEEQRGSA
jgi:hypothetical protein